MLTAAADTIATMFGNASDSITGSTGPWVRRSVADVKVEAAALLMRQGTVATRAAHALSTQRQRKALSVSDLGLDVRQGMREPGERLSARHAHVVAVAVVERHRAQALTPELRGHLFGAPQGGEGAPRAVLVDAAAGPAAAAVVAEDALHGGVAHVAPGAVSGVEPVVAVGNLGALDARQLLHLRIGHALSVDEHPARLRMGAAECGDSQCGCDRQRADEAHGVSFQRRVHGPDCGSS